jgi:hypothetical protein
MIHEGLSGEITPNAFSVEVLNELKPELHEKTLRTRNAH